MATITTGPALADWSHRQLGVALIVVSLSVSTGSFGCRPMLETADIPVPPPVPTDSGVANLDAASRDDPALDPGDRHIRDRPDTVNSASAGLQDGGHSRLASRIDRLLQRNLIEAFPFGRRSRCLAGIARRIGLRSGFSCDSSRWCCINGASLGLLVGRGSAQWLDI